MLHTYIYTLRFVDLETSASNVSPSWTNCCFACEICDSNWDTSVSVPLKDKGPFKSVLHPRGVHTLNSYLHVCSISESWVLHSASAFWEAVSSASKPDIFLLRKHCFISHWHTSVPNVTLTCPHDISNSVPKELPSSSASSECPEMPWGQHVAWHSWSLAHCSLQRLTPE